MVVRITNLTDGPGRKAREFRVYNKRLQPGKSIDVPAQFVDDKVRKAEAAGYIAIGQLPPWYSDYRSKRKVRNLSAGEVTANIEASQAYKARKEAGKVERSKLAQPASEEIPVGGTDPVEENPSTESEDFDFSDSDKGSKGQKKWR